MCKKWEGSTHFDRVDNTLRTTIGDYLMGSGETMDDFQHPSINQTMIIEHNQNGDGHVVRDYVGLLCTGMTAVRDKARVALEMLDETDGEYLDKKAFLDAVILCLDGYENYCRRLARGWPQRRQAAM